MALPPLRVGPQGPFHPPPMEVGEPDAEFTMSRGGRGWRRLWSLPLLPAPSSHLPFLLPHLAPSPPSSYHPLSPPPRRYAKLFSPEIKNALKMALPKRLEIEDLD
eukprot:1090485-Pyramimonas_sp.AAC.1